MPDHELRFVTDDGLNLYGREWPARNRPRAVVAFIPGIGEHCGRYSHLVSALTGNRYSAFGFDQRGHGRSEGKRVHTPSYGHTLRDLHRFVGAVRERSGDLPLVLYGHSLGGNLVVNYVLRYKPDIPGAVVSSPWLRGAGNPPLHLLVAARLMNLCFPYVTFSTRIKPIQLTHDPAETEALLKDPLYHDRISARMFFECSRAGRWALAHAEEFAVPLLLMHGDEDTVTSHHASKEFASRAPRCTFRLWPGMRHELHNEIGRDEVLRCVVEWLGEELRNH